MKRIYIIALIFAVLTGLSVYNYSVYLEKSAKKEMSPVVVAVTRIPENSLITVNMVEVKLVPSETVNSLSFSDINEIKDKITNTTIEIGEQVLSTKLIQKGTDKAGLTYAVPGGKRAITIEVNDITGVAGYIKKGNYVDVIAALSLDKASAGEKTEKVAKTLMLLQNIEVLAINTESANAQKVSGSYTNITVALTPEDTVKLFYAQTYGKLTVALRPVLEDNTTPMAPYSPAA